MSLGNVKVNNVNLQQGSFDEIENRFLFIGEAGISSNNNKVLSATAESDLDTLLGVSDSDLKTQLIAARNNAGTNWSAIIVPIDTASDDWRDAVDLAMSAISVEGVVVCPPITTAAEINDAYTKATEVLSTLARPIFIMLAYPGIDDSTETWADYTTAAAAITNGIAANRVMVVPQLHGNNLGVIAGRLANQTTSLADSPMKVATGTSVGLGNTPTDINSSEYSNAEALLLDASRFTVPQTYPDYEGIYWSDGNTLETASGDFKVIENLRVLDYLARRVRIKAIARVADRKLNSTPGSIASHITYFSQPLREASRTIVFSGQTFPGMIHPPQDGDVAIQWNSTTEVNIYIAAQPYNSPKKIEANLMLDLSGE